jgi:hypothetical protein
MDDPCELEEVGREVRDLGRVVEGTGKSGGKDTNLTEISKENSQAHPVRQCRAASIFKASTSMSQQPLAIQSSRYTGRMVPQIHPF